MINLSKALLLYFILTLLPIAAPIHETGHLFASEYLGIGSVIESSQINKVVPLVVPLPDDAKFLFYVSGGLYQFSVFFVISLFLDKTSELAFKMVAIQGLVEGVFETNTYMRLSRKNHVVGVVFALTYFGYVFIKDNQWIRSERELDKSQ